MCGICGALNIGAKRTTEDDVRAMTAMLSHRGPDAARVVSDGHVILGHARLSIIDLSGGGQPMASHDRRYWIVFNGEIFNYLELRTELEGLGYTFVTRSDTEVIIEAYRAWGGSCFRRFNGQWGVAIWDRAEGTVTIARDRVGIRPLYYCRIGTSILFSSEIKSLFAHPRVQRGLSPSGLAQAFTFWSPVAPRTAFEGIEQLPPGTYMAVRLENGSVNTERYWEPTFGTDETVRSGSLDENAARLRDLIVEAARLRFDRSDVPVGAYLSGGIDSTVTTAVLARYTDAPLKTFSVAFSDGEFDESGYQDLVSRHLGTEHERVVVDSTQIGEVFPEVVWHGEHPILRTAPAPLFLLSGLVRSAGYKVVVTGEGSDEVLAGYDIFRETIVRRYAAEHPDSADLDELVVRLYPWMERSPTQVPAFAKAFFGQAADVNDPAISHRPRWRASGSLLRMLDPEFGAPPEGAAADELLSELPERFWSWDPVERAQYLEMSTLLPGYILAPQGDRMLMGHSVEGRFPFLDHNVIEFASSLPVDQKLRNLDEKHILKHAFRDIVPVEVIDRPKQPYRAPDAASFFSGDALPAWLDDLLDRDYVAAAGVFRPEVVEGVVRKARSRDGLGMSNTDNMRIVALISTMLLHTSFVSGRGAFERARREADTVPFERIEPRGVYAGT